ncbi:MAG: hypothetical protein H6623_03680 [Bdellovibrionaceae bacterium]|nr:hypothetical protein [Pseudobdellovibrionaceae bacterium]
MSNKNNRKKTASVLIITIILGTVGLMFQNFTPHDPFQGQKPEDLFMSTSISEALDVAKKKSPKQVALASQKENDRSPQSERKVHSEQIEQEEVEVHDTDSF